MGAQQSVSGGGVPLLPLLSPDALCYELILKVVYQILRSLEADIYSGTVVALSTAPSVYTVKNVCQ